MSLEQVHMAVRRLILQFKEYEMWSGTVSALESQLLTKAARISQDAGTPLPEVLQRVDLYPELVQITGRMEIARQDQARISHEMSFANHMVWMMYKHEAYKGTPSELLTVGAFARHCSPKEYICTKRYTFLRQWLVRAGVDIADEGVYPPDMLLETFYTQPVFMQLMDDTHFLQEWKKYEYYIADGTIAKWANYISE
ncbi:MAG: hypothetical protein KBD66_00545 [Candidatus Doudnabacteria bacterium]|nr:hypothetical protein [Candidatus Doudnabacteria bacterium]